MSSQSPLNAVVEWFLGRVGDRRQYKRRSGTFHMWWQPGGEVAPKPGIGLELSPNGVVFVHHDRLSGTEHNLILRVRDAKIATRVRIVRSDQVTQEGKQWNRYMCEFTGIGADDWDRIVRYVNDEPETEDRRKMQNQEMGKPDDAYRLLPMSVQQRIVAMLVERKRLDEPHGGQSPLMKLFYGGLTKTPDGKSIHRINVHSRIAVKDELIAYDTRFYVSEDGEVKLA